MELIGIEVNGYPNYVVYNNGEVYSRKTKRFLSQCLNRGGYLIVNLSKAGTKPKSFRVHRLVAEHFLDRMEGLNDVNHIDGNKQNNHITNLEWSNKSLNGKHAYSLGLNTPSPMLGEKHGMSKLTEKDIIEIREKMNTNSILDLSKMYNVSTAHIHRIITRKAWKHLD